MRVQVLEAILQDAPGGFGAVSLALKDWIKNVPQFPGYEFFGFDLLKIEMADHFLVRFQHHGEKIVRL